jgi:hypothetical protein
VNEFAFPANPCLYIPFASPIRPGGPVMERFKKLFRQTEFHIVLFFLSLVLFGWPIVHFPDAHRAENMFVYLFLAWGMVIVVLYLVSTTLVESGDPKDEHEHK